MIFCAAAGAQEINIYSEFQRFDPFGVAVPQDRDLRPREILSPAVPRNGHLTVHVVVTAPSGTNYFLYAASNPPGILGLHLYREHFVRCGNDYCPDWLTEQRSPAFGAIPESVHDMPDQTARSYLLDIAVPASARPQRIRVEALLKVGTWLVAPMEVRVTDATIPVSAELPVRADVAPVEAPSSDTAQRQLLRYLAGLPPEMPAGILRVRDAIQRNAAEDLLLAHAGHVPPAELGFEAWGFHGTGAEWYLRVRDHILRAF